MYNRQIQGLEHSFEIRRKRGHDLALAAQRMREGQARGVQHQARHGRAAQH